MKSSKGKVLYVGKAKNLKNRVSSYFQAKNHHSANINTLLKKVNTIEHIVTSEELDAFILEKNLIKEYQPLYNVKLRDDKQYPFIKLTNETYPRLIFARKVDNDKAKYFGPFSVASEVRKALKTMKDHFKLRTCKVSDPTKNKSIPCLNYHMNRCLAPCISNKKREYQKAVQEVTLLLTGRTQKLQNLLIKEMKYFVSRKLYEKAAICRDKVKSLTSIQHSQKVLFKQKIQNDIIGIFKEGTKTCVVILHIREGILNDIRHFSFNIDSFSLEKTLETVLGQAYHKGVYIPPIICIQEPVSNLDLLEKWLFHLAGYQVKITVPKRGQKAKVVQMAIINAQEILRNMDARNNKIEKQLTSLKNTLMLKIPPKHIEAFDISNLSGKYIVGSKVSFVNGLPHKSGYRKYNIRTVAYSSDDFASMYEIVKRRLHRLNNKKEKIPHLILVDGGKGQLNAALKAREEEGFSNIPFIGLAKKEEEIYLENQENPLKLPKDNDGLLLLRHIRDEAHRFAISFHRKKRKLF